MGIRLERGIGYYPGVLYRFPSSPPAATPHRVPPRQASPKCQSFFGEQSTTAFGSHRVAKVGLEQACNNTKRALTSVTNKLIHIEAVQKERAYAEYRIYSRPCRIAYILETRAFTTSTHSGDAPLNLDDADDAVIRCPCLDLVMLLQDV
jgi:hypothetical protein